MSEFIDFFDINFRFMEEEDMRFPDVEAMSAKEAAINEAACSELQCGSYYVFDPPVEATAIPLGGGGGWKPRLLLFARGCYLGFSGGSHIFQGRPVKIPADIDERFADSYFPVLFTGGVTASLDSKQD